MPYIKATVSKPITPATAEAFKTDMGKAIVVFPGKTERWLMVNLEGDACLWMAGDNSAPSAMVEVSLLGEVDPAASSKMTALICDSLACHLGVPAERVYVKYTGVANWGWNGGNF